MHYSIRSYLAVMVSCFLFMSSALGMATRHDRSLEQHKVLAAQYPSPVVFGRGDGAGVLITDQWVLTAAHVAESLPVTGQRTVTFNERRLAVSKVYLHPDWDPVNKHDLALVQLSEPVSDWQSVILSSGQEAIGDEVVFLGAGDFTTGDSEVRRPSRVVHAANNILDRASDLALYFDLDEPADALDLEGTPAGGDSGGPVLIDHPDGLVLIGINSVGLGGPNGAGRYGVGDRSVRVSAHRDWIEQVISGQAGEPDFALDQGAPERGPGRAIEHAMIPAEPFSWPDNDSARSARQLVEIVNHPDAESIDQFLCSRSDEAFQARNSVSGFHDLMTRLAAIFGEITPKQLVTDAPGRMTLIFSGSKGIDGAFELQFSSSQPGLVSSVQAATFD